MNQYSAQLTQLGWMFVAIAALFACGLVPGFARRTYPGAPSLPLRMAAPVIFSVLATACFLGVAFEALVFTVAVGVTLVIVNRVKQRPTRQAT